MIRTESYFAERAARASIPEALGILERAGAGGPPDSGDELPATVERRPMSPTYLLFRRAILARKQVVCTYRGRRRELCPHILGHTSGEEKVLAFQFGGESAKGLPPERPMALPCAGRGRGGAHPRGALA